MKMPEVCCKRRARKLLTYSLTAVFTATVACLVRCCSYTLVLVKNSVSFYFSVESCSVFLLLVS